MKTPKTKYTETIWFALVIGIFLAVCYSSLTSVAQSNLPFGRSPLWFAHIVGRDNFSKLSPNAPFNRYAQLIWTFLRGSVISIVIAFAIGILIRSVFQRRIYIIAVLVGVLPWIYGHLRFYYDMKAGYAITCADYIRSMIFFLDKPEPLKMINYLNTLETLCLVPFMTWVAGYIIKKPYNKAFNTDAE